MQKLSLVFLTRRTVGGIKAHILSLASALDKKRYNITVIGPIDDDFVNKLEALDIDYIHVDIADKINPLLDFLSTAKITRLLKKINPDILHIHGNKSALIGRWAAKIANVNNVIVTVHNFLVYQQKKSLVSKLAFFEERRLSKSTKYIIAVSNQIKDRLVADEGIAKNKIKLINNGIDLSSVQIINNGTRDKYQIHKDAFVALNISRLVEFKGQKYLIEAAKQIKTKIPNFKLIIAGSGPLKDKLKKYCHELGLSETVSFINHNSKTNELYSMADCFILPSFDEPFGLVLLEAIAYKLPIIATRSGGVLDILDDEKALLVKPKNSANLAEAVIKVSYEKQLSQELVKNAYQSLEQRLTLEQMVQKTEKLYELLSKNNSASL